MIVVCLSFYNGALFLKEQLKSIEEQSFDLSRIVLLVRDDGSTDTSHEIVTDFMHNTSLHVILLEDRINLGVKKSFELLMNEAVKMNAQYIMFSDQDDVWLSYKIAKSYDKMQLMEKQYPKTSILVHSDLRVVCRDLHVKANSFWKYQNIDPSRDTLNRLLVHNTVTGCTMMINRALAEKIRIIPNEAIMHDWWIAMVASIFGQIAYIDDPLMLYRQHNANDTGAKQYGWWYIVGKFFEKPSFEKYVKQSQVFLYLYEEELNFDTKMMLEEFCQLLSLSKFAKIKLLYKYKIFWNGFVRNLGLILFV